MRGAGIPTSQAYQVQVIEDISQSEISRQNSGVLHEERIMQNGTEIGRVKVHHQGHVFTDNNTHEYPHYHGQKGEHFSYESGKVRNTNKYKGNRCF
jgi:hypothetical protein